MKKKYKIIVIAVALAMCTSIFSGCNSRAPKDAVDLLSRSKETMNQIGANYNISMNIDIDMNMNAEMMGVIMAISAPIEVDISMDRYNQYAHGNLDVKGNVSSIVEYEEEKETQQEAINKYTEIYAEIGDNAVDVYSYDESVWSLSGYLIDSTMFNINNLTPEDLFASASMIQNDHGYLVSIKLADLIKNEKFRSAIDALINSNSEDVDLNNVDIDLDQFAQTLGDSTITYEFDQEYRLIKMCTGKIDFNITPFLNEETLSSLNVEVINPKSIFVKIEMSCDFSKFGEIKESDVKITESVKDEAVDLTQDDIVENTNFNENTEGNNNGNADVDVSVDTTTPTNESTISDVWRDMDLAIDGVVYKFPYNYHALAQNGWKMNLAEYGYENGYVLNKGDQTYSTFALCNDTYGGGAWDAFTIWCGFENFGETVADITECDLWSIQLDIINGSGRMETYPDVRIAKDITFGSSKEDVVSAFGEPDNIYESESYGYVTYEYQTEYDRYLSLTICNDYGVTGIDMCVYGD
jgi:hypothetical protein